MGNSLTLSGQQGLKMAVTVTQVIDPEQGGQFDQPDDGTRYIGVFVRLANVGPVNYDDSPSNGATLISTTGEQAQSEEVSGGACGNDFSSQAIIAPGDAQTGCLVFEMPTTQRPGTFQFTLNSGFADTTGQWNVAGKTSNSAAGATGTSTGAGTTGTSRGSTTVTRTVGGQTGGSTSTTGTSTGPTNSKKCDPNITAGAATSCPFAENVFRAVAKSYSRDQAFPSTISASSPTTGRTYTLDCSNGDGVVSCETSSGASATFSQRSILLYDGDSGSGTSTSG